MHHFVLALVFVIIKAIKSSFYALLCVLLFSVCIVITVNFIMFNGCIVIHCADYCFIDSFVS